MPRFDITAQLELRTSINGRDIIRDIERQLGSGVDVDINIRGGGQAGRQMNDLRRQMQGASDAGEQLGRSFTLATRRFAAFTVASRAVSLLTNNIARAVDEAIDFERELVKISQVTGKTVNELRGLTAEITRLSVNLGVSSKELLGVSRILAQAGIQANDLKTAIGALAKTTLAPTFDDISKTAEGAVAILSQFEGGVGRLEAQLGSINAVAGQFAVESGDLIDAVRRFGGVFKSAGGSLEELLALFTSVRATTRESAESIGTGLRTIFTRIQRPATLQFLDELGVKLTDTTGKFVGPFEAVKRLSEAFAGLEQGDIRFVQIAEELGGFRQIGKVIPLLQQFATSEEALKAALEGQGSLTKDAVTAQQALSVQFQKTRENFLALVREITDSDSFRLLTSGLLGVANAAIELVRALKPLLPILAGLAAYKSIGFLGSFAAGARGALGGGLAGMQRANSGGRIHAFASGGFVPGTGNRDTVPAMLTPGEFVIKKSSAAKLGPSTLQAMNENKFAKGGPVVADITGRFGLSTPEGYVGSLRDQESLVSSLDSIAREKLAQSINLSGEQLKSGTIGSADRAQKNTVSKLLQQSGNTKISTAALPSVAAATGLTQAAIKKGAIKDVKGLKSNLRRSKLLTKGDFPPGAKIVASGGRASSFSPSSRDIFNQTLNEDIPRAFSDAVDKFPIPLGGGEENVPLNRLLEPNLFESVKGSLFEAFVRRATGVEASKDSGNLFDFDNARGLRKGFDQLFDPDAKFPNEFKNAYNESNLASTYGKAIKTGIDVQKRNSGGGISGSGDTVPALLTPGEFVVNKKSAQSIGYGNLARMNRDGVARFAKGGSVGVQKFAAGGIASAAFSPGGIIALTTAAQVLSSTFESLNPQVEDTNQSLNKYKLATQGTIAVLTQIGAMLFVVKGARQALKDWGDGVSKSEQAIEAETSSRNQSAQGGGADAAGGTSGGGSQGGGDDGDQKEQVSRTEKLAAAEKKRLDIIKKSEGNTKGIAAVEDKIVKKRRDVEVSARKLANTQETLRGRTTELNSITRNANGSFKQQTEAEKARARVLRAEITQLKTNESTRRDILAKNISQRKQLQGTLRNLNGTLATNQKNAINAAQSLKRIDAIRAEENSLVKRGAGIIRRTVAARKTALAAYKQEKSQLGFVKQQVFALTKGLRPLGAGFRQLGKEIKRLRKESKGGFGVGGKLRRGAAGAGRLGASVLGGAFAIGAIGSQIAAGLSQFADREKETAIKTGNVGGAIKAANASSVAQSVGDAFTLSGFIEAVGDPQGFVQRRDEKRRRGNVEAGQQALASQTAFVNQQLSEGGFRDESGAFNTDEFINAQQSGFDQVRLAIDDLPTEQEKKQARAKQFGDISAQLSAAANQGASLEDLRNAATRLTGGLGEMNEKAQKLVETLVATREAQQQLNKANIDSLKITSAFNSANAAVAQFTNTITAGADPLQGFFGQLQASKSNIGVDATGAITAIEQDLVAAAQNAGADDLVSSIQGQAEVARDLNKFSTSVGTKISSGEFASGSGGKAELEAKLLEGVDNPKIRAAVKAKVAALKDEEIATTDISKFVQEIQSEIGELSKGFDGAAQALIAHNQHMNQLYAQREQLEQQAAQAQIKAIDLQLEAAKIAESAGGPKVSSEAVSAARVAQFNAIGGLAGVQASTGSAQDIARVREQLSTQFLAQQQAQFSNIVGAGAGVVKRGVFAGPQGRQEDIRPESIQAQQALIQLTKQQIQAKKEELQLIKQKNAAEKSALDKLISGDVEGFIAQQEAAGAAAALETGSSSLAGLFDASALGRGFQELEKRGDATLSAAQATLGAFGITDATSAGVLSGQTPEEQAAQKEIRDLAGQLGGIAQDTVEFANSNIAIQDATIQAANVSFNRQLRETSEANAAATTGFARGGMVYASRGMFIPRGTDTVPAMLTPGEFVVNRSAVQRGNNLQMLQAMNSGGGASAPAAMSGGGSVRYYETGGFVSAITGAFSSAIPSLQGIFDSFTQSVEKLSTTKFSVQLDPVSINIEGGAFLQNMKEEIRNSLLSEVGQQLQSGKINNTGAFTTNNSVLNPPTA